jgi:hypothetical protein
MTSVKGLLEDLAQSWRLPSAFTPGPSGLGDVVPALDRSFLDRPGPQPHNSVAGTMEAQLARLWDELARREAGLPPPPGADEVARFAAVVHYHKGEVRAALGPLVTEIIREVLRGMDREWIRKDHDGAVA